MKKIIWLLAVFFVVKWTEVVAVGGRADYTWGGNSCQCHLTSEEMDSPPFADEKEAREFMNSTKEEKGRLAYDFKIQQVVVKDIK